MNLGQTKFPEKPSDNVKNMDLLGIQEIMEDRILVLMTSTDQTSSGGIILPTQMMEERCREGIVICHGPGEFNSEGKCIREMKVNPGDRVVYGKFEGSEILFAGKTYHIIRMLGVIMTLKPKQDVSKTNPNPVASEQSTNAKTFGIR